MGRMHAPGKGISQSALPYRRSVPTWLKLTPEDCKELIFKLAKKGYTPSQIGVILRDSHGVAQVRFRTGNKILRIVKSMGLAPDLPEDLYHLIKRAVGIRKHLERNRKDKDSKFRLILVESRIHRLARYYKTKGSLPPNWKLRRRTQDGIEEKDTISFARQSRGISIRGTRGGRRLVQSRQIDHIQEVLDKWNQIDDEIWAKVIVFERNRRVAKAYARAPVLTINGSNDGFDGFRIGLCGFDNPMRDPKTEEAKRLINQGVKIKMDEQGNILIKRLCKNNVYIKPTNQEDNAIGPEIIRNSQGALEHEKPGKLFDMNKFKTNLFRETQRAYPDRRRLEMQCLSAIVFVRTEADLLQCPVWVLIVNVVGLDMLKSKLPPVLALQRPVDIKNRPRIPIPDEDPYSVAGVSSSVGPSEIIQSDRDAREQIYMQSTSYQQRRAERPPKLPPRENLYGHDIPKPDYDDIEDDYSRTIKPASMVNEEKRSKNDDRKKYDDPYYCGLRARVPNFVKMARNGQSKGVPPRGHVRPQPAPSYAGSVYASSQSSQIYGHHVPANRPQIMYHARSFESGLDSDNRIESPYNHIYGRLPIPTRGVIPPAPRAMYIGEWD
ncbi:hypothetical protein M0802_003890 [Mischocyttarus mexicanus]|nr:hypothetical protein M0802_003890 [Mischocyttarus mexicanus]